jgi:hypothetical protein
MKACFFTLLLCALLHARPDFDPYWNEIERLVTQKNPVLVIPDKLKKLHLDSAKIRGTGPLPDSIAAREAAWKFADKIFRLRKDSTGKPDTKHLRFVSASGKKRLLRRPEEMTLVDCGPDGFQIWTNSFVRTVPFKPRKSQEMYWAVFLDNNYDSWTIVVLSKKTGRIVYLNQIEEENPRREACGEFSNCHMLDQLPIEINVERQGCKLVHF